MEAPLQILMVEDSEDDALLLLHELKRGGYETTWRRVEDAVAMRTALEERNWDIITSDHAMPNFSAPAALALVREVAPETPVIIVSGEIDLNLAVSLMKNGAQDYVQKRELARVVPAIQRELREIENRRRRQQTERELREIESRYTTLLDTSPDAISLNDQDGKFITVNKNFLEMFAYPSLDEFLRLPLTVYDLVMKEDRERLHLDSRRIRREGVVRGCRYHALRRNGSQLYIEISSAKLMDPDDRMIGYIAQIRDISDRQLTENELRSARDQMRQIVESIGHGFMVLDKNLVVLYFNRTAERMFTRSQSEVIGKPFSDAFPDIYSRLFEKEFHRVLGEQRISQFEISLGTPAGENWYEVQVSPFEGGISVAFQMTTERKINELALRRERLMFERIMETSPVGITVVDAQGKIIFANRQAEKLFGMQRAEITSRHYNAPSWKISTLDGKPLRNEDLPYRRVVESKAPVFDVQHQIERADGSQVNLSINAAPIFDESGEVEMVVAVIANISLRQFSNEPHPDAAP